MFFWVYDGANFIEYSPRPLTDYGLPGYVDAIDAVQIWGKNGDFLFVHVRVMCKRVMLCF